MDAREKLRRFLEQRRDMGTRELVLDDLAVDEAMRLLGAAGSSAVSAAAREDAPPLRGEPAGPSSVADLPPEADWRSVLRAAGADPADRGERRASPGSPSTAPSPSSAVDTGAVGKPPPDVPRSAEPPAPDREPPGDVPERPAFLKEAMRAGAAGESHAKQPLDRIATGIVVGAAAHELFAGPVSGYSSLDEIAAAVASCTRCPLHGTAKRPVPGEGNPEAGLVCVGEAPGAVEDETGRPFVGAAGQLLDKMLAAIKLSREDVFICNVLKHRPPNNRNPAPDEVQACSPYLVRQIELIRPRVIVAFGTFAAQTLLNTRDPIGKLRGQIHRYYGVPLVVTYHPAALLRNPAWKRPAWDDVQLARRLLDRAIGS